MNQPQDSPGTPDQDLGEAADQSAPSSGGAEQIPSGYGTAASATTGYGAPGQSPSGYGPSGQSPSGYGTPAQPGYGTDQAPSGYGTPGQAPPGYGTPAQAPPGYGTPASQAYPTYPQPGYGTPGQAPPGYGAPAQAPPGYGTPASQAYPAYPQPGYGTPGQAPPGYGTPPGQAYPSYPQPGYGTPPGQAYPAYPQAGYGQPYQPGYGQYQGYGQPYRAFEPVNGRRNPALAEWWRRLLARIIDGLILGVIFSPLWIPPWRAFFTTVNNLNIQYGTEIGTNPAAKSALAAAETQLAGKLALILLGLYVVAFLYDWIQHWQWGQTIGKRALGTRVVREDGNPRVGAGAACGRAAIYVLVPLIPALLSVLGPLLPLAGSLFALVNELWLTWDPRSQCLHDKAAHTVVVKKAYQGPQPQPGGWQPGSW